MDILHTEELEEIRRSVREFAQEAFACAGLDWEKHVKIDPRYFRPTEVDELQGDPSKAREKLGWRPKVSFKQLVQQMVDADMEAVASPADAPHHETV